MSTSVGSAPQPTQKWKRGPLESVLPVAVMFTAMACFTLPLWYLFVASSKNRGDLTTTPGLWFSHFQLGTNVSDTVNRDGGIFWRWLLNSVLYAGVGAAIGTVIAAMAGYALAKYEFRGREATFNTILAGVLVPATALALPLFLIFAAVGLTNTYWSVLLPSLVSPFGVYLSRIYASASVPDALIEAARLDGVGEFRIFLMMATALMRPALVTIFLFQVRRHLEQLLPAAHHAGRPKAVPDDAGPVFLEFSDPAGPHARNSSAHRGTAVGRAHHRRLLDAAAILARRTGCWWRQGMIRTGKPGLSKPATA